jgi:hypothetical protein
MTEKSENGGTRRERHGQRSKSVYKYEMTRRMRKMVAGCTTPNLAGHAAKKFPRIAAALRYRRKPSVFHEGKRQIVRGDAHGDGEVGMRNT